MKTRNEKLNQAATVAAKAVEVLYWICGFAALAVLMSYVFQADVILDILRTGWDSIPESLDIPYYIGFAILIGVELAICVLGARIFCGVYLLFRTAAGKTSFSLGPTPFQPANVKLLRQMGRMAIGIPLVEILGYGVAACLMGPGIFTKVYFSIGYLVLGVVVLCLSQFFAYGVELQTDVEGRL